MSDKTLNYYNQHAQHFNDSTLNIDMSSLYGEFLPLVEPHGHILDAGCGSARDALYFKQQGFRISAFDASEKLASIASQNLKQVVEVSTFQTMNSQNQYDGIWCCASLLHVPKIDLPQAFLNLKNAMKDKGVLYVSFKYGNSEREQNGRVFTDLNEATLEDLIAGHTELKVVKQWQSVDQRPDRKTEIWLNALIRKETKN